MSRHDNFIVPLEGFAIRSRGRLPHWQLDRSHYFVTFRLRDSLPREVIHNLIEDRNNLIRRLTGGRPLTSAERCQADQYFAIRLDIQLDAGRGECLMARPDVARIVANALRYFDGDRYQLRAWCVMPNHVHVMFYLERGRELDRVLQSWKSFTAHAINRVLNRTGVIWQREYFDRIIRSDRDYEKTRAYILRNPDHARLENWPWVGDP